MNCPKCLSTNYRYVSKRFKKSANKEVNYLKCKDCNHPFTDEKFTPDEVEILKEQLESELAITKSKKKVFVVTSCQSNAPTNTDFVDSLVGYCNFNDAELKVIPIKYRNPRISEKEEVHAWDENLEEYFLNDNIKIHEKLVILGKLKINATSVHPLTGIDSIAKGTSIIIGHNQLQMKTVPVAHRDYPVIITTTGTVSESWYSESKAGYQAEFNHSLSAIVVELDGDLFHIRQLEYDGKGFYDLDNYYHSNGSVSAGHSIEAMITGDEHAIFAAEEVKHATYLNEDSIAKTLKPSFVVRHDLLDCYSVSHHHKNNIFVQYAKNVAGTNSIKDELDKTVNYVLDTNDGNFVNVIVGSNHNDHLTKWLMNVNIKEEPWNALIYHGLMYNMLLETRMTKSGSSYPNPFEMYAKEQFINKQIKYLFVSRNDSFKVLDIECAFHGDIGNNGSRGSRLQFSKLASKTIIGHSHSPGIEKGCYQVGTSSYLEMDYNIGPSSWMNTHCLIYKNGKRTLINVIKGKWKS